MGIYDLLDGALTKSDRRNEAGEPEIQGVVIGVVVENNNDDFKGMVKVELLVREGKKNITDWIKVVSPYGGTNWGMYNIPEVGDEVLVAFEQGSIHKPFVIGSIYMADNKMVNKAYNKENNIKSIRTRGGHEIVFYDQDDSQYIDVKTPKKINLRLDDKKNKITLTDADSKNLIEIDIENSKITIQGESKILLNSNSSKISIEGDSNNITAKSSNIKIEGSNSIKLKAQSIDIDAGMLNVKASNVMNLKSDGVANVKGAVVKIN